MLLRYQKILRGKTQPRFIAAQKSGALLKQLTGITRAKHCILCNKQHKPPAAKVKISVAEDPTFRNAVSLSFSQRGTAKTPAQAAALVLQKYKRGKKTLIISGDVAHGLPFLLQLLEKLAAPAAIVLVADPLYSEKATKIFKRIVDVHALTVRWADPGCASHFGAEGYVGIAQKNVKFAANSETIVRIPLLPGHIECDAKSTLEWLSKNVPDVRVQFVQSHKPRAVERAPELSRTITITELNDVVAFAHKLGLNAETIML